MHRASSLLIISLLVMLGPLALTADAAAQQPAKEEKEYRPVEPQQIAAALRRTERLFGSDEPLEFTLTADFKQAFRSRDTLNVKRTPATMVVNDTAGNPVTIAMEISPRGHFRLRNDVCNFPPIKLHFPDSGLKHTPFAGQGGLKLGTHCRRNDKEYAEYPVREHAAYEVHNLLTDVSFRTRLAKVSYVQTGDRDTVTTWGLLIEDEDDVAKRNGGRIRTIRGGGFADMDPPHMLMGSVFAYFLGNTDWSIWSLHNYRLIFTNDGRYVPVGYDFDWSGIVWARYAKPAPQLGIRTVQERLYRGPCATPEEFKAVFDKFVEKRDAIREVYQRLPFDDGYRRKALAYIDDFYKVIGDQRQIRREFMDACVKGS